ncbi:hypothetical protein VL10_ORF12 [Staphylococcus phage vB_SauM_VL10]|nr:hypothetical protein VL10_ORF12 [Staphylococcus phage vB_SauM_VL10]
MKETHGYKFDKRKSMLQNAKENGIKKTLNKNSGIIRIKESRLKTAKRNNDIETIEKLERELQELYKRVID